ncbi:low molecular weight phosphatase family protein [Niveispirillum sp. SYP-B3756]|uniref:arsenate reductase ArsC n=1 Tax=Niveispirillum sp. SYP-B3756 TaxID=2662178 RepID=UPI001292624D|nr:arsenate reductase ArsC [Niveispirillum sp. SYP-B3756]MQP65957.1 low molecular weight phosphatase family protein [Niveispirillum sp. SYP-B3756]
MPTSTPARISSVLFACTHNSIRSPMAEGLLKMLYGKSIYVDSAGVREGDTDPFVTAVMAELGVDMSRHHCKTFDQLQDDSFDLVISLSPEAQHKAVEMTRTMACDVEFWHTFDPSLVEGNRETRLDAYRQVRDTILKRLKDRFPPG